MTVFCSLLEIIITSPSHTASEITGDSKLMLKDESIGSAGVAGLGGVSRELGPASLKLLSGVLVSTLVQGTTTGSFFIISRLFDGKDNEDSSLMEVVQAATVSLEAETTEELD